MRNKLTMRLVGAFLALSLGTIGWAQDLGKDLNAALNLYFGACVRHDMFTVRGMLPLDFTMEHMDGQVLDRKEYLEAIEQRNDFVQKIKFGVKLSDLKQTGSVATGVLVLTTTGDIDGEGAQKHKLSVTEKSRVSFRRKGDLWEMTKIQIDEIEQRIDGKVVGNVKREGK